jgi:hypothetical protein
MAKVLKKERPNSVSNRLEALRWSDLFCHEIPQIPDCSIFGVEIFEGLGDSLIVRSGENKHPDLLALPVEVGPR